LTLAGLWPLLLVSCGKPGPTGPASRPEAPPKTVTVTTATVRPLERVVQAVGTLAARDEAIVAAQVAGQIETNHVDLGDRVRAGQELVLIHTTSYEALARQAAANLAKARASADNAAQNLKRIQDLQQDRIASSSELDLAVAEAAKTQADVKAAEAAEAIARLNLERSRVKAPFDGLVAQRFASAGDYVGIGARIVQLVQTDPLRLRLEVPERDSPSVRAGQTVRVRVDGDTNVYVGKLARVAPAIRETDRMLLVEADVPNPGGLRAGLFARAEIVIAEREPAVCVPANALVVFAGLEKVLGVKDGKAVEKNVTTGRRDGDWVEIVRGLQAGEVVVLDPGGLRTGQALIVQGHAATAAGGGAAPEGAR
jgi:RND family efflux transporter MFP subunit